jgi:hypothetical protein
MLPHERDEYRQTMGHLWQGFDAAQLAQWACDAGFAGARVHALPALPGAKGPTLFSAVLTAEVRSRKKQPTR